MRQRARTVPLNAKFQGISELVLHWIMQGAGLEPAVLKLPRRTRFPQVAFEFHPQRQLFLVSPLLKYHPKKKYSPKSGALATQPPSHGFARI